MSTINDDRRIEEAVESVIKERMYKSAHDVKVQSRDGYVTLLGFVDVLNEKNTAGELAANIQGVKSVENCLTISTDGTFTDKEAEIEVMNKLGESRETEGIGVNVQRGVAVLEGKVSNLGRKNLAIHQASKAHGVKDVVSHIEIDSLNKIDDTTIHNNIQAAIGATDLQDCHIRCDVDNGSVRLHGYVNNVHDMETAMEIAETVEGVRNIKNELKFREKGF